jgi:pimeloyl-ACP methyl ester carboxylesterase
MSYYADSNGTKIYYEIRGEGEPLVLLMGFGADGSVWEKHVSEYEKHFKCIVLDNRGVGKSDQPEGPYTTKMMAEDTVAVMQHAGVDKARIAGISMGGAITQELALNFPEKVQSIALISTWPKFNNYAKTVYENLKKLRVTSKPDEFMELLQLWIFAPPFYEDGLNDLKEGQAGAGNNPNPQTQFGFEGQLDACINHDTVSRLNQIKVPTMITVGDMDIFTPPAFSKVLHDGIGGSKYVSFPEGGHVHHWEDLERFNKITSQFLKEN